MKRLGLSRSRAFHLRHERFAALPIERQRQADRDPSALRRALADYDLLTLGASTFYCRMRAVIHKELAIRRGPLP